MPTFIASLTASNARPDWQDASRTESADLLNAFEMASPRYAVGRRAVLDRTADKAPAFSLEFMIAPSSQSDIFATLRATFIVPEETLPNTLNLLPSRGGVCRLETGRWRRAIPFAWDGRLARIEARLSNEEALLLYGLLRTEGASWITGALEGDVDAMLPRPACRVLFQPGPLIDSLQSTLAPNGDAMPWKNLVDEIERRPLSYVRIMDSDDGDANLAPPAGIGLAIAGRLRQSYGASADSPSATTGPWLHLWIPSDHRHTTLTWDLRTPQLAAVPAWYALDPFELARTPRDPAAVCRVTQVAAMPGEARTMSLLLRACLPAELPGVTRVDAEVVVDAALAEGGLPFATRVTVYCASRATDDNAPLVLRYASWRGPRRYRLRVTVVGTHKVVSSPWRDGSADYVLLSQRDLPALTSLLPDLPPFKPQPEHHCWSPQGDPHE